ncbi:coq5 family [Colletotrichum plurivorum]|uniref:Coq5 family n=1 Tax=Colletotrichum plurivorum TaxID=2175906 RepID=A0A8H6KKT3_9PEZI|nr:coq5 family [Colletotrichum plurivorum]
MKSYTQPGGQGVGRSKLFLNPADINSAGDRTNYTTLWRRPDIGSMYRNTEHITAPTTQPLIDYCGLTDEKVASLEKPVEVLDMCCGAGVVSAHIHAMLRRQGRENDGVVRITCADSSEAQLEHVRKRIQEEKWADTKAVHADIASLPFESNTFDYVITGMAIMVVAEPYAGLSELNRVLKPGGRLSTSTWAVEGWVQATRGAVADLRLPGQEKPVPWPQESHHLTRTWSPGAWDDPYFTSAMYNAAGFAKIDSMVLTKWIPFEGGEHFRTVLSAYEVAITERYWSKEQKEKLRPLLAQLILDHLRKEHSGRSFTIERSVVLAGGTKPLA